MRRGFLALVAVVLIWSCVPVVLKYFTHYLDAWTMMGVRFSLATLFLAPSVYRYFRSTPVTPHSLWRMAIVPAGIHFAGQTLWGIAPYFNQASVVMFVGRCAFLFSMLAGFILLPAERHHARARPFQVGVFVTLGGLGLMFAGSHAERGTSAFGLLLMVCTSCFWGLYGVSIKKWLNPFPARVSFGVLCLYTWPGFIALMFTFGDWRQLGQLSMPQGTFLAVSAVLSVVLGHVFSYTAIRRFGPILTEGIYNVIPLLAAIFALLFLGDAMSGMQWAGGLLILAGSACFLATMAGKARNKSA